MSAPATTAQPSYLVDTGVRTGLLAWLTTTCLLYTSPSPRD